MLFEKIIRFINGYFIISVTGKFPERFLNVCANKGILVTDVTYLSPTSLRLRISSKSYKALNDIPQKTSVKTEIIYEGGFPVIMRKYKKRKSLIIGAFSFILALFVLNLFVWEIEITGCEKILPKKNCVSALFDVSPQPWLHDYGQRVGVH